jgi:hypothetical protein
MVAYWYLQIKGFLWSTAVSDEMNDRPTPGESSVDPGGNAVRRPVLLVVLAVIVGAEAIMMAGVVIWLVLELLTTRPAAIETAVAILVLAAIAAVFLGFVSVHLLRASAWTRAATLTWQLFQIVIAIGCFQGIVGSPDLGWFLLVPALFALVLLFSPPIVAALRRI